MASFPVSEINSLFIDGYVSKVFVPFMHMHCNRKFYREKL